MVAEIILAAVSFIGLLAGLIIMRLAKEEQKSGMPYFLILKKSLVALIIFFFLYYQNAWIGLLCLPFLLSLLHRRSKLPQDWLIALIIGIIFVFSANDQSLLIALSALTFFYFMVVASMQFNKRKLMHIATSNIWFFLPHLLLFLL